MRVPRSWRVSGAEGLGKAYCSGLLFWGHAPVWSCNWILWCKRMPFGQNEMSPEEQSWDSKLKLWDFARDASLFVAAVVRSPARLRACVFCCIFPVCPFDSCLRSWPTLVVFTSLAVPCRAPIDVTVFSRRCSFVNMGKKCLQNRSTYVCRTVL